MASLFIDGAGVIGRKWLVPAVMVLAAGLHAIGQPASSAPSIERIAPPNWWIGLPDPMLMLTGENLRHARVRIAAPGVQVIRTMEGREGRYLFVWLKIGASAKPGDIPLQVVTDAGARRVSWKLERRNSLGQGRVRRGCFDGFDQDDVIYLVMPDRFADGDPGNNFPTAGAYDRNNPRAYHGGDFRGIQERLPYLKDLGVTALWITPIYDNDDRTGRDYHGYGAVDLYAVEEHFGTLADYRALVRAAHALGLKIILDIVPNHVGPAHPWAAHPPTGHWLHGSAQAHLTSDADFQHLVDPHASPRQWRNVVEGWFAGVLPDLATDDAVVSRYLRQNALWWAETGAVDGFRLDTFPYVDRGFWRDFHSDLHRVYPRFRTVGEVSGDDPIVAAYFSGGRRNSGIDTGVDTVFDFPLYAALRKVILEDAPAGSLEDVLKDDWLFPHPDWLVTFLGNHDKPRFMGMPGATTRKLDLAFALLLTMRGIPQIYSGDEIAMAGGEDPDNRRDFPGGFPGDRNNAFEETGRSPDQQEVFRHVRSLLHLRREHIALRRGKYIHLFSDARTLVYVRVFQGAAAGRGERLLIIVNNADQERTVEVDLSDTMLAQARKITTLLADHDAVLTQGSTLKARTPARSLGIYQID